jgi:hypothetical protein
MSIDYTTKIRSKRSVQIKAEKTAQQQENNERFEQLFPSFHDSYVQDGRCVHCINIILRAWDEANKHPKSGFSPDTPLDGDYDTIRQFIVMKKGKPRYTPHIVFEFT